MHNISLSHDADEVLNVIYEKYKVRLSSHKYLSAIQVKLFYIHSLFQNSDDVIYSLVELSNQRLISIFSDGRIMIKDEAISYIERCFMEC